MPEKFDEIRSQIKNAIKTNPELSQKVVAITAGITDGYLSQLLSGARQGRIEIFVKLAKIVGVEFNFNNGELTIPVKKDEPFPRFMEIMSLPIPKRPGAIKAAAAEANGLQGWMEAGGDEQRFNDKPVPREHQRYFDGEITEIDLFEMYDRTFKQLVKKLDKKIAEEGL